MISGLQGKKSRVSFKNELFCMEIKKIVPKRIWTASLKTFSGMIILFLQTLHCRILTLQVTHGYPGRGVWSDLNMPEYNLWSNCIEKQISGLIRHRTQILVIFIMFDTHCQHFICKYSSKSPKTDIQNNRCISISLDKFVMQPQCYLTLHDCIVTHSSSFFHDSKNSWQ